MKSILGGRWLTILGDVAQGGGTSPRRPELAERSSGGERPHLRVIFGYKGTARPLATEGESDMEGQWTPSARTTESVRNRVHRVEVEVAEDDWNTVVGEITHHDGSWWATTVGLTMAGIQPTPAIRTKRQRRSSAHSASSRLLRMRLFPARSWSTRLRAEPGGGPLSPQSSRRLAALLATLQQDRPPTGVEPLDGGWDASETRRKSGATRVDQQPSGRNRAVGSQEVLTSTRSAGPGQTWATPQLCLRRSRPRSRRTEPLNRERIAYRAARRDGRSQPHRP